MEFLTEPFQKIVPKPWGHEILYTPASEPYTGKIQIVDAGKRWSLHYHETKKETLCLLSGQATIWLQDKQGNMQQIPMVAKRGYTITPKQAHRIEAISDCVIIEASDSEWEGTTVRLADDFARKNETEDLRKQEGRGWKEGAGWVGSQV